MVQYGGPEVLFVIDNVHAAEAFTGSLFDEWRSRADGSTLLLSGRHVSPDPWRGVGDELHDLGEGVIRLRVNPNDVFGTYRRLASRIVAEPPSPTRFLSQRWSELFRGDLVAFGAALSARQSVEQLFPDLSSADAVDGVRARYVAAPGSSPAALEALNSVAALGVLELASSPAVADIGLLEPWLSGGALVRVGAAVVPIHSGLARLLLAALGRPELDVERLAASSYRDRSLPRAIARRLAEHETHKGVRAYLAAVVRAGDWVQLLPDALDDFAQIVVAVHEAAGVDWASIDEALAGAVEWAHAAESASTFALAPTIALCGRNLPRCSAELQRRLFPAERPAPWFTERLERLHGKALRDLIAVVARHHPQVALGVDPAANEQRRAERLIADIQQRGLARTTRRRAHRLLDELTEEGLDALDEGLSRLGAVRWVELIVEANASVIRTLSARLPATGRVIGSALDGPEVPSAWIAVAARKAPVEFVAALAALRDGLPALHRRVSAELAEHGDAGRWAYRALVRSESLLGTNKQVGRAFGTCLRLSDAVHPAGRAFVARADAELAAARRLPLLRHALEVQSTSALTQALPRLEDWPQLHARLHQLAGDEAFVTVLAREVGNASLAEFRGLLRSDDPLAIAVIRALRSEYWESGRAVLELSDGYGEFSAVVDRLERLDRADLAEPLAVGLAQAIVDGRVAPDRLDLAHASHLLRLLPLAQHTLRSELVGVFADLGWLERALFKLSGAEVAQALFSLRCHAPELTAALSRTGLEARIATELAGLGQDPNTHRSTLRLIGSVSLFRPGRVQTPEWAGLEARELIARPSWEQPYLVPGCAQVLLGLEQAGATLPAEIIAELVARCERTEPETAGQLEILTAIRAWLDGDASRA